MKKLSATALLAAITLNVFFFILIGWAWFHASHKMAVPAKEDVKSRSLSTSLINQHNDKPLLSSIDAVVEQSFHNQVTIQRTFVGPGNLDGLVLALKDSPTEQFIAYFDPHYKLLYLGQVLNAKGQNTTIQATETFLTDPQKPKILQAMLQQSAVITGSKEAKHTITVVIDPNSPYFKPLYNNFYMDVLQDGLRVRWVLVNYLKPMGPNLAGWILSAPNPAKRLNEVASQSTSELSGLQVPKLSQAVINTLRNHWNVMQSYHLVPGPVTVFQTKGHIYILKGLVGPESFEQTLPDITD